MYKSDRIYSLWDELADFEVAKGDEARSHLLNTLCELVDGCDAVRFISVRMAEVSQAGDPLSGWRPTAVHHLRSRPVLERRTQDEKDRLDAGDVDATTIAAVAGAGHFRVHLLTELAPP